VQIDYIEKVLYPAFLGGKQIFCRPGFNLSYWIIGIYQTRFGYSPCIAAEKATSRSQNGVREKISLNSFTQSNVTLLPVLCRLSSFSTGNVCTLSPMRVNWIMRIFPTISLESGADD
jgi:hypothetical protein